MEFNFSQIDLKQEAETREKIYFAVILLLIVIAFSRWFYLPKIQEIKMIQVEANNANLQIGTLKQFAQLKLPAPDVQSPELTFTSGTKFEQAIEASKKSQQQVIADIIKKLTSTEVLGSVSLAGMNLGSEVNKGNYGTIPAAIDLDGKYSAILSYMEHVEKFGKLITIDNLELSLNNNSSFLVHAKINANIYVVYPEGAALPEQ